MADPATEFAQLLVRTNRALLRYILTFVPSFTDAEEVLQRTVIVLWEKFPEYDRDRPFLPWAQKVAYFEILNYRKEYARSRLLFSVAAIEALAEAEEESDMALDTQRSALQRCLKKLRTEELALIQRRYCDSESIAALALESGKTAKSLYRRLDRIREMITVCVERQLAGNFQ